MPYEEITQDLKIFKSSSKRWFIAGTLFLIIAIICITCRLLGEDVDNLSLIAWTICAVICFGIYILKYESVMQMLLTDGKAIFFFLNKPSDTIFNEFIESLYIKRNEYLKEKYTKIDEDLPLEQQLYRINLLKEEDIINNVEYKKLKELIIRRKKEYFLWFSTTR